MRVGDLSATQRVRDMLAAARDSPMGRQLAASGFEVDMNDAEQANALALHVLHQIQVMGAATRLLAERVEVLESQAITRERLFL